MNLKSDVKTTARELERDQLQGQRAPQERLSTSDLARAANSETRDAQRDRNRADLQPNKEESATPLFPPEGVEEFRARWTQVQTGFVDEPRVAVEHADELVAHAIKRLAESFAEERGQLESQWAR